MCLVVPGSAFASSPAFDAAAEQGGGKLHVLTRIEELHFTPKKKFM
jgi:hypothetical protein